MDELNFNENLPLFEQPVQNSTVPNGDEKHGPMAHALRPTSLVDFIGWEEISKKYPFLQQKNLPSLVLHGPPGTGKTTLAKLLAEQQKLDFQPFNAVLSGIPELKKIIAALIEKRQRTAKKSILFIDEIHRFNKGQQDALLPYVEKGDFILIGATTEYPKAALNQALLSRIQLVELPRLDKAKIKELLNSCLLRSPKLKNSKTSNDIIDFISDVSGGDARRAINALELCLDDSVIDNPENLQSLKDLILENSRRYDKGGVRHYDVISAFIKSMRGSDPDAALLWLAVMLEGGEDPAFIARRMVIFASEDVGNADPTALSLSAAALNIVEKIGLPEARISLGQAASYLASTVKSNAAYKAIDKALDYVKANPTIEVPEHLKNYPRRDAPPYQYPHSYPGHFVPQEYTMPENALEFYSPTDQGREKALKERLESIWKKT